MQQGPLLNSQVPRDLNHSQNKCLLDLVVLNSRGKRHLRQLQTMHQLSQRTRHHKAARSLLDYHPLRSS